MLAPAPPCRPTSRLPPSLISAICSGISSSTSSCICATTTIMPEPLNISGEEWRLRELVSEAEVRLGPKHPEVALRLMKFGSHLVHQNRVEDARECYKRAVELLENRKDEFQAELVDACFSVSSCYSKLCEWDEAFPWLERAMGRRTDFYHQAARGRESLCAARSLR